MSRLGSSTSRRRLHAAKRRRLHPVRRAAGPLRRCRDVRRRLYGRYAAGRRRRSRLTCYHFNADEDTDDGISYYLDCVASYPAGLTAAQVAQRVQTSYHYDNNSFSSEADRDDYIRRQLQNEISDEYADRHDGAIPTRNT